VDDRVAFARCLRSAGALHDWGKANDGFQAMVTGGPPDVMRHEHLSGLLMGLPGMDAWLRSESQTDWEVVLAAVVSHHLKVTRQSFARREGDVTRIRVLSDDDDFSCFMGSLSAQIGLSKPVPDLTPRVWDFHPRRGALDLKEHVEAVLRRLSEFESRLRKPDQEPRRRLLWAVRSALIAADALGSAMRRESVSLDDWVRRSFDETRLCTAEFVQSQIMTPRVEQLKQRGKWSCWSAFQLACDGLPARSLLLAPCGSGKSLAAWRWIAAQCRQPVSRIVFLYPTRATATEGFRDYVSWAPEADAALMHGTADYDLVGMFDNGDRRSNRSYEVDDRLYALGFWTKRVFSATVDQFLAFMQHAYGPTCMLPVLADSVIVIDEVHSFDANMFAALKDFLRTFVDVPVLCMTATLSEQRRRELSEDCGLTTYCDKPGELQDIANAPRYRVSVLDSPAMAIVADQVYRTLANGRRVLWVVNQVRTAQLLACQFARDFPADELFSRDGAPLFCYHSRFRLEDRRNRHRCVVQTFPVRKPADPCSAALAITTQVCEMSLDMDADLLVTEIAPVTAMIQRMGRCNRFRDARADSGEIVIYAPETQRPYDADDLAGVPEFLNKLLGAEAVTQAMLERFLAELLIPADLSMESQFLKSGPFADAREAPFRDIDEFTVRGILDCDVQRFLDMQQAGEPTAGLIVPVPRGVAQKQASLNEERPAQLPKDLTIVSASCYHKTVGLCEQPVIQFMSQNERGA
jgi:CRISPR-associated endonuclease/helicase Cas3